MSSLRCFALAVAALSTTTSSVSFAGDVDGLIGKPIESFTLNDIYGRAHSLAEFKESDVVVVAFLGTECPLAKLYAPRMEQLWQEYRDRGVAFLGVNSNRQDSITELAAHARRHGITFPMLKDLGNEVADLFGAERTPEMFVLDRDRVIRYRGRIDDQYGFDFGVGYQKAELTRRDLANALDEVLAGNEVSVPTTVAKGCIIGRVREANEDSPVTYSNQIARIYQDRCAECHREGQIAPFSLTSYEEVAGWGEMIEEVVRENRMPPWHANPAHGTFSNDLRLTADERESIFAWVKNGCPEGDPADLPEPRKFAEGWWLPREPDLVISMPEPYEVPAEGVVDYQYIAVDPGFTEDKWVQVSECRPGNPQVVHHIIVYVRPPETADMDFDGMRFLAGFAPGTRPFPCPDGAAKRIPAGSKLVFEMHYTPCGSVQEDLSSIGFVLADADKVTQRVATTGASNHEFEIPAGAGNHRVDSKVTFTRDGEILAFFPHMHLRGKAFRYSLRQPDGTEEILLDVPRYDFNWQYYYVLDEPRKVSKGAQLRCLAYFDNSEDNLANPDPSETVRYGPQTWEEMMIGWYTFAMDSDDAGMFTEEQAARAARRAARKEAREQDDEDAGAE